MVNRHFDAATLELLLHPERWRLVSALFPDEISPVQHPAHRAWMRTHADRHVRREVLVPLRGRGVCSYRGVIYPCEPGMIFLFDAQEEHDNFYPPHITGCEHLWLNLLPPAAIGNVLSISGGRSSLRASMIINDPAILALLDNHWTAAAANAGLPPPVRRAKMLTALSAVLLELVSQGYGEKAPATGNEHHAAVIHNVLRHMLESGGRQLSTEQLARIAGYSKYHFLRLFKKHSGRTVRSCIDDCCLARIATLRQAGKNHSEVAAALGFSSLTVYSRWRKRAEQKRRP